MHTGPSHAMDTKPASKQKVMATPLPGGGVMQTPMLPGWKGAQFGGAFATVVKKAGRGAKTNAGNAIVVTCSGTYKSSAYGMYMSHAAAYMSGACNRIL